MMTTKNNYKGTILLPACYYFSTQKTYFASKFLKFFAKSFDGPMTLYFNVSQKSDKSCIDNGLYLLKDVVNTGKLFGGEL
jgi:hypothetical protein